MRAVTPWSRAAYATDCPWLPVDAAISPRRPLVLAELGDEVDAAANLERPDRLVVLVLHPDLGAEQLVEARIRIERSRPEMRADPPARLEDVGEGDRRPVHARRPVSQLP